MRIIEDQFGDFIIVDRARIASLRCPRRSGEPALPRYPRRLFGTSLGRYLQPAGHSAAAERDPDYRQASVVWLQNPMRLHVLRDVGDWWRPGGDPSKKPESGLVGRLPH